MNIFLRSRAAGELSCVGRSLKRRGLTMVEITITLSILLTILVSFSQALTASMVTSRSNREVAIATDAARQVMESLQSEGFATLFAANNSVAVDDPGVPTLRLAGFAVAGLDARNGDADGLCGEILMPEGNVGGVIQLREDMQDFALDMPRDLNGDGVIDALDHANDYMILPVIIRIDWRGAAGPARVQFKTILSELF